MQMFRIEIIILIRENVVNYISKTILSYFASMGWTNAERRSFMSEVPCLYHNHNTVYAKF